MDQEVNQLVQAINIASDPQQSSLHSQALEYLSSIQQNVKDTWRLALALFVESTPDGVRKHPAQARFYALRLLDEFFDNRIDEPLDAEAFQTLQQSLISYIRSEYVYGQAESSAPYLRNKFSHTLTLFFLSTYIEQWPTFFTDLFVLIRPPAESSSQSTLNAHISLLFFHVVLEISGEVADQMIKAARSFTQERHVRDARVRDTVRARDAAGINEAVLTIVADGAERMCRLRKGEAQASSERELDVLIEVVDWGVRTFGSYVGWIDINLTVTPSTIPLLFTLLSDSSLPIRLATSAALLRMVSKGLKEPGDKIQLIKVLSLREVLGALEDKTRAQQANRGDDIDEGEESYREALGRLLNALGLELVKLAEAPESGEDVRSEATSMLEQLFPVMLRFMADEYDDTCSTVFPLLQMVLSRYKRLKKSSPQEIDDSKRAFLTSLLGVVLEKLKWDETADPDDMDDDDKAAFENLRKDLRTFLDSILMVDQNLVTEAVQTLALNTLTAYENGMAIKWHDAELAIYLVYMFGEINKTGGKGRAAFCQAPAVAREKRKETDYSEYPLTSHGEMLFALVRSGISAYPHPTVAMQYFETTARYGDFFKVRKECIIPTLEAMLDTRGVHHPNSNVRSRVFYLFYKFVKEERNEVPVELAVNLLEGIRDVLAVQVELPELDNPEQQDLLTEAINTPGLFDSQLYLFETAGILVSLLFKTPEQQTPLLLSVVKPLLDELSLNLQVVKGSQDVLAVLKIHHIIMALGNVTKGFPELPSPVPDEYILPPLDVFREMAQAIILSLEAMNIFKVVRDATRSAFVRILAVAGPNVAQYIPALMTNLLAHFEPPELVDFLNFLGLVVHKLQGDIFDVLDQLFGPLSAHITQLLSQPVTGTDDKVMHADMKKGYLNFLNNVMVAKLHSIFISERNKGQFEGLLNVMQQVAEDTSDPNSQRVAFTFLGRCVSVWGSPDAVPTQVNGNGTIHIESQSLPGFERYIYERLVPLAFKVPSLPDFNLKDGQMLVVLHEIATFLQTVCAARGQEAYDFLVGVFFPSQNWPADTAVELATKMRTLDNKTFRKYFTEFVRASRPTS